ncbi:hypothetical protein ENUP19_0083G0049 [Entamoeba nuttalli]|uniref:Serine/threonine-protein phosphatase n=1 Tax=Entamoeba nuttalli TaxID=412467 RepID=A0ABQ0DFN6_9EUKA
MTDESLLLTEKDLIVNGKYDLAILQNHFSHGGVIDPNAVVNLINKVIVLLNKEPNLIQIESESLIFGDIHGNYFNFINILNDPQWEKYPHVKIFLGDYVDRGKWSTETIITLLCLKYNNPDSVVLLRGNHESSSMTHVFGFETECLWKYNRNVYSEFINLFNYLPLCVLLLQPIGTFFLCHGGISPSLRYLSQILRINRFKEPPEDGLFCDLLWSDPLQYDVYEDRYEQGLIDEDWYETTFIDNDTRGCSYFYGYEAVVQFLESNEIRAIIRAHECVDGVQQHDFEHEDGSPLVFTVFSSPAYDGENRGGVLFVGNDGMKVKLYSNIEPKFKSPIYIDAFKLSMPYLFDKLQIACDQLMILMFNPLDDDIEEDLKEYSNSSNESITHPILLNKEEDSDEFQEPEQGVVDPLDQLYKEINEESVLSSSQSKKDENDLYNQEESESSDDEFRRQLSLLQKRQPSVKSTNSPNEKKNNIISIAPPKESSINKSVDQMSINHLAIASLPNSNIILGSSNEKNKLFLSLTTPEKKKGFFRYKFNKRNESVPLSLSQLRDEWNKLLQKESKDFSDSKDSINSSKSSSLGGSLSKERFF